jgi:hypothetical protein
MNFWSVTVYRKLYPYFYTKLETNNINLFQNKKESSALN